MPFQSHLDLLESAISGKSATSPWFSRDEEWRDIAPWAWAVTPWVSQGGEGAEVLTSPRFVLGTPPVGAWLGTSRVSAGYSGLPFRHCCHRTTPSCLTDCHWRHRVPASISWWFPRFSVLLFEGSHILIWEVFPWRIYTTSFADAFSLAFNTLREQSNYFPSSANAVILNYQVSILQFIMLQHCAASVGSNWTSGIHIHLSTHLVLCVSCARICPLTQYQEYSISLGLSYS